MKQGFVVMLGIEVGRAAGKKKAIKARDQIAQVIIIHLLQFASVLLKAQSGNQHGLRLAAMDHRVDVFLPHPVKGGLAV